MSRLINNRIDHWLNLAIQHDELARMCNNAAMRSYHKNECDEALHMAQKWEEIKTNQYAVYGILK